MQKEDLYYLGKITKVHGFKGNLILFADTDDQEFYKEAESVFIERDGIPVPFFFEFIQPHGKNKFLVKFEDTQAEEAARLVGKSVFLPMETLPELEGTDFYYHEIIGYRVIDAEKGDIGLIESINDSGLQALFEINFEGKQILIPIIDDWITGLDRKNKIIQINAPEGLIDLYL